MDSITDIQADLQPRKRLTVWHQISPDMGVPPLGLALVGTIFALIGGTTLGRGVLSTFVDLKLIVITALLVMMGMLLWFVAGRMLLAQHRQQKRRQMFPDQTVMHDYLWDPDGFTFWPWRELARRLPPLLFFIGFMCGVHYLVSNIHETSVFFLKAIMGIFDIILILVLAHLGWNALRAAKFGCSRLVWDTFPILPGTAVALHIQLPRNIAFFKQAELTLRCIEEFWEENRFDREKNGRLFMSNAGKKLTQSQRL